MIKFCKNCENFRAKDKVCLASPLGIDLVTGEDRGFWSAAIQRESMSPDKCGEQARKFVPLGVMVLDHAAA